MIRFNENLCIGCGSCVADCFPACLALNENGKAAFVRPEGCMRCGHCIAVCPMNAVFDDELNPADVSSCAKRAEITGEAFSEFIRFRRTVRSFTEEPVSDSDLQKIILAARVAPTASNTQSNSQIVLKSYEAQKRFQGLALRELAEFGKQLEKTAVTSNDRYRAERFGRWLSDFEQNPNATKHLFFNAPVVMLFVSPTADQRDASTAAAFAELQAESLGLGVLYSGFFCHAANQSEQMRKELGLTGTQNIARCLVIGHPAVHYFRSVPRNPENVRYL